MKHSKVILLPLVLILLTPFLVYEIPIVLDGEFFQAWTGAYIVFDYFSIIKSVMLISSTILILFFMLGMFKELKTIDKIAVRLVLLFILLVLVSHLFSEYKQISLFGIVDRFEGTLVLISYGLILLYTLLVSRYNKNYQILFSIFIVCSGFLALIGVLQFINLDPLLHPLIYDVLFPAFSDEKAPFLASHFGRVDITMYNSNYVGSFVALTFPITFFMLLHAIKPYQRYLYLVVNMLLFIVAIASRSRAGLIGIVVALVFGLILTEKSKMKRIIFLFPTYILLFSVMNLYSGGELVSKFSTFVPGIEDKLFEYKNITISEIQIDQDQVYISTDLKKFTMTVSQDIILLKDDKLNEIPLKRTNKDEYKYSESNLDIIITRNVENSEVINIQLNFIKISLLHQNNKLQLINARNELLANIENVESCCFTGRESFASYRGYIWSRSIPMLKDTLLIGHGADTYTMYFPQHDVLGKLNSFGSAFVLLDKPHNNYLQIAHDTGVLSLFVLFALILRLFFVSLTQLYSKKLNDNLNPLKIAVLSGIVGYLIAAVFNDSTVHVAPYFWFILGLSFALNDKILMKQENE